MENLIAYYCAPTLKGIKPSNIVSCHNERWEDICLSITKMNLQLNPYGYVIKPILEGPKRVLVMVYQRKLLKSVLQNHQTTDFLSDYGYPKNGEIKDQIKFLEKRLTEKSFPHEIGAFLGYPLHDIYGFLNHKTQGCILCGEWRVYEQPEKAKKTFESYAKCRQSVIKQMKMGKTLKEIVNS